MDNKLPKSPEEWQAHDDAYTLVRAAEVRQDSARLKSALIWVEELADETQNKAKAVQSLVKESARLKNKA